MIRHPTNLVGLLLTVVLLSALGGCVKEVVDANGMPVTPIDAPDKGTPTRSAKRPDPPSDAVDVSTAESVQAAQLHDVCGAILAYFAANQRLPDSLEELKSLRGFGGDALPLNSPRSGVIYAYHPDGIVVPGQQRRIVVYDPVPSPERMYWAILMAPPQGRQAPSTWVIQVPEVLIRPGSAAVPNR